MKIRMELFQLYLPKEIHQKVKQMAETIKISMAELIRKMIKFYIDTKCQEVLVSVEREDLKPYHAHEHDAGYDIKTKDTVILDPGDKRTVPTGVKISVPSGMECQIRPRSGLSTKGVIILNSPGTIDPGYIGEISVIMMNIGKEMIRLEKGERIAQMVFAPVVYPILAYTDKIVSLVDDKRGSGGFGSTGTI